MIIIEPAVKHHESRQRWVDTRAFTAVISVVVKGLINRSYGR